MDIDESKSKIDKYQEDSKKILTKVLQAFRIKKKIEKKKNQAILLLEKDINHQKAISILEQSLMWDGHLLEIAVPGIEEGIEILDNIKDMGDDLGFDEKFEIHIKHLIDILRWIEKGLKHINKRVKLEEAFIKSRSPKKFSKFVKQWNIELQYHKQLLEMIEEGELDEARTYFMALQRATSLKRVLPVMSSQMLASNWAMAGELTPYVIFQLSAIMLFFVSFMAGMGYAERELVRQKSVAKEYIQRIKGR